MKMSSSPVCTNILTLRSLPPDSSFLSNFLSHHALRTALTVGSEASQLEVLAQSKLSSHLLQVLVPLLTPTGTLLGS